MDASYRHSMNMLDANYPQLASYYTRMMTSARIVTPPKLEVLRLPLIGAADEANDAIYLDSKFVEHEPKNLTSVVIGHESGHILAEHGRINAATASQHLKQHEHEADRIAVHLTGSHDDVSALRTMANESVRHGWSSLRGSSQRSVGILERALGHFDGRKQRTAKRAEEAWKEYVAQYGTPEELEANIRGVDLSDRRHVDALIAQRNHKTNPELG